MKYATAAGGDCIQVGKFQYLGGNGERCTHYYDWPADWNSGVLNGNTYEASVDVSSANYVWPAGVYTVSSCHNNEFQYTLNTHSNIVRFALVTVISQTPMMDTREA